MADSKQLTKNSMVWKKGMEQWEKAGDFAEDARSEFTKDNPGSAGSEEI